MVKSRNVVAQTKTGDTHNVVVAGAHLDSFAKSPGINDNGTGVAALLETAAALGAQPQITNAVRFAFWGSEEAVLAGSTKYVEGLDRDQLDDIALYLNFDMLGSPNAGFFTYDGDQSGQPNPDVPAKTVPAGSAGIERTLAGYLNLAGIRPADMPLGRASDYSPFLAAGVPIGGATTGASQRKSEVQERLWGGVAGVAFDRNNHTSERHRRQRRPRCTGRDGSRCGVRRRHLRPVDRGSQRGSYPRAAPPAYALAMRVTNW